MNFIDLLDRYLDLRENLAGMYEDHPDCHKMREAWKEELREAREALKAYTDANFEIPVLERTGLTFEQVTLSPEDQEMTGA